MRGRSLLVVLSVLVLCATHVATAQLATAFKTGEETTGMTKQCYYDALGNGYTLTLSSVQLCPLSIQVRLPGSVAPASPAPPAPPAPTTVTAFKTGEQTTGMTKQCFYDALGNAYTRTISSVELCPLSIQVRIGT